VRKEQKLYLWDWAIVPEQGPRFENFIASQLLKYCHFREDIEGYNMDLRFLRDTDRREVDFVVLEDGKPLFAVECKAGEKSVNPSLYYFIGRTKIPKFYQVHEGNRDFEKNGVRILPIRTFCKEFQMP
jgi:predicted AAA+ superfamily ATPase